jgi:hypothetical protein
MFYQKHRVNFQLRFSYGQGFGLWYRKLCLVGKGSGKQGFTMSKDLDSDGESFDWLGRDLVN